MGMEMEETQRSFLESNFQVSERGSSVTSYKFGLKISRLLKLRWIFCCKNFEKSWKPKFVCSAESALLFGDCAKQPPPPSTHRQPISVRERTFLSNPLTPRAVASDRHLAALGAGVGGVGRRRAASGGMRRETA